MSSRESKRYEKLHCDVLVSGQSNAMTIVSDSSSAFIIKETAGPIAIDVDMTPGASTIEFKLDTSFRVKDAENTNSFAVITTVDSSQASFRLDDGLFFKAPSNGADRLNINTNTGDISGLDTGIIITGSDQSGGDLILRSTTDATKGNVRITESTDATALNTGALVLNNGGASIAGNLFVGGTFNQPLQTPASASDTGTVGSIAYDAGFIYICVGTDEWERAPIATW